MGYPPAENLLAVLVSGKDEATLEVGCKYLKAYALRIMAGRAGRYRSSDPPVRESEK